MPFTADAFADFTAAYVAGGASGVPSNLGAADTTLWLPSGVGNGRPYPSTFPFYITIGDDSTVGGSEIVRCTARSGDQCTIVRSLGGTNQAWTQGTALRVTFSTTNANNLWTAINSGRMYNVLDYGADKTGASDSTTAFTTAQSAASAAGEGSLYAPAGTYLLTSGALALAASVALVGDGPGQTFLKANSATGDLVTLNGAGASISRLQITAPSTSYRTAGAAVNIAAAAYDMRIADVHLESQYTGITVGGAGAPNTLWLTNIHSHNATNVHLNLVNAQNLFLNNIQGWNDGAVSNNYGLFDSGVSSIYASNLVFFQCGVGFGFVPASTNILHILRFTNCLGDTCTNQNWLFSAGSGTVEQVELVDCWGSSSSTASGLLIDSTGTTTDITLLGFSGYLNHTHGIICSSGSHITIIGAHCAGNSQGTPNTSDGIHLGPPVSHVLVKDCQSAGMDGYTSQNAGINIAAGVDYYVVTGNDVTGNTTGITNNATGAHGHISDNLGYNPVGSVSPPAFPATTIAAQNTTGLDVTAYIANGTAAITVVQIAGQGGSFVTTGLQIAASGWGSVRIPAGASVKFTYSSGSPSWTWFAD